MTQMSYLAKLDILVITVKYTSRSSYEPIARRVVHENGTSYMYAKPYVMSFEPFVIRLAWSVQHRIE